MAWAIAKADVTRAPKGLGITLAPPARQQMTERTRPAFPSLRRSGWCFANAGAPALDRGANDDLTGVTEYPPAAVDDAARSRDGTYAPHHDEGQSAAAAAAPHFALILRSPLKATCPRMLQGKLSMRIPDVDGDAGPYPLVARRCNPRAAAGLMSCRVPVVRR